MGPRPKGADHVGLVIVTHHQAFIGPDAEHVEHVPEHFGVGFATSELALDLNMVDIMIEFEALDRFENPIAVEEPSL